MTREDVIRMALDAGAEFRCDTMLVNGKDADDFMVDFAAAAYAAGQDAERESRKSAQLETIALREDLTKRAMQAEKEAYQRGVRDEREACAKVCESIYTNGDAAEGWLHIAADKIRARGEKGEGNE